MFGKDKENIKEQFIKFLMEDAHPQKKWSKRSMILSLFSFYLDIFYCEK